jgi:hypothetical protein
MAAQAPCPAPRQASHPSQAPIRDPRIALQP